MKKSKIIAIAICLMITILTILRLLIDSTTLAGTIIRIMWIISGILATILAAIHLMTAKKRTQGDGSPGKTGDGSPGTQGDRTQGDRTQGDGSPV